MVTKGHQVGAFRTWHAHFSHLCDFSRVGESTRFFVACVAVRKSPYSRSWPIWTPSGRTWWSWRRASSPASALKTRCGDRHHTSYLVCLYIRCHVPILCFSLCRKWGASWSNSKTDCRWEKMKSAKTSVCSGQTITTCLLLFLYRRRVWRSEQKPSWTSTWRAAGSLTWCVLPGSLTRWRICFLLLLWSQKYSQIYSVLTSWLSSHTFVWVIKVATMLVMLQTAHSGPL